MGRHGQDASEQVCYFGVERLRVDHAADVAGVRLLPLGYPDIPDTNPLFKLDQSGPRWFSARPRCWSSRC
jgi:hypothetical protein